MILIIGVYAGYYMSRVNFKFKRYLIISILSARMMPLVSIAIPIYFVYEKINLLDTYIGIIFVHTISWYKFLFCQSVICLSFRVAISILKVRSFRHSRLNTPF